MEVKASRRMPTIHTPRAGNPTKDGAKQKDYCNPPSALVFGVWLRVCTIREGALAITRPILGAPRCSPAYRLVRTS